MSLGIDRRNRVLEVLAESGHADLVEVLIWPALAALTSCPEPDAAAIALGDEFSVVNDRVRRCAGAFIRVAADVVSLQSAAVATENAETVTPSSARAVWRAAVVNLGTAVQSAGALHAELCSDERHRAIVTLLRQMLDVADRVASWLEHIEPRDTSAHALGDTSRPTLPPTPPTTPTPTQTPPTPRSSVGPPRRRPWFGAGVGDAQR